jgi:predicted nucleotidyltransferase component of viral defense system
MTRKTVSQLSQSIWTKLVNRAKARGEDPNYILMRFAGERFLYRLSISRHGPKFLLKGAMLFAAWSEKPHRSTKDVDLLGTGDPDGLAKTFQEICTTSVTPDDAVQFDPESLRVEMIREDEEYDGRRVLIAGTLGNLPLNVQIDVGFGDAVSPDPLELDYPVLLDQLPSPRLRTYPPETVIAEKFEAMVKLGLANSRMKDFYDIWALSRSNDFKLSTLRTAVRATFDRRGTTWPSIVPLALTPEFGMDTTKGSQWRAFLGRTRAAEQPALGDVVQRLQDFLTGVYSNPYGTDDGVWHPDTGTWGPTRTK